MTPDVVGSVVWGVTVAGLGAWLTDLTDWYRGLKRPSWQPPDWLFGPAWSLILACAAYALYLGLQTTLGWIVIAMFVVNGVMNIIWSPLFFKLGRPDWSLMEVPFLWLSILVPIVVLWPESHTASLFMVPYLLWVSFAAFLNWTIVRLNRPFRTLVRGKLPAGAG